MQYWNNDPTHYTPEVIAHLNESKPLAPCIKCAGEGFWINPKNPADKRPCFKCGGTGDNRVTLPFKRQSTWSRGPRTNPVRTPTAPVSQPEESKTLDEIMLDAPEAPLPAPNSAADRLAQLLAEIMAGKTPIDADSVRDIVREEIENATLPQAPQTLDIVINGEIIGELPAIRHHMCERLMRCIAAGQHVFLVGPAGSGKTTAAEQVAKALNVPFYIQGAIADCVELTGFIDGHGKYHSTPFRQAFEHGGVILLDEFDGSIDAGAPLKINSATANDFMAFPDQTEPVARHPDFVCIAAANTYGTGANAKYIGRTQLDAATLDRFYFMAWNYDPALESAMCPNADWLSFVQRARAAVDKLGIETVISPRAAKRGAALLAAGMDRADVEAGCVWRGLSAEDCNRIRAAM